MESLLVNLWDVQGGQFPLCPWIFLEGGLGPEKNVRPPYKAVSGPENACLQHAQYILWV